MGHNISRHQLNILLSETSRICQFTEEYQLNACCWIIRPSPFLETQLGLLGEVWLWGKDGVFDSNLRQWPLPHRGHEIYHNFSSKTSLGEVHFRYNSNDLMLREGRSPSNSENVDSALSAFILQASLDEISLISQNICRCLLWLVCKRLNFDMVAFILHVWAVDTITILETFEQTQATFFTWAHWPSMGMDSASLPQSPEAL